MAYLRGDYYIWGDGDNVHIGVREGAAGGAEGGPDCEISGVFLPYDVLDQYVVMRFAEILHEGGLMQAMKKAIEQGNFGSVILEENADELLGALQQVKLKPPQKPRSFADVAAPQEVMDAASRIIGEMKDR